MKIKININSINSCQINDVINFFNLNKPCKWNKLEKFENGFQIKLNENEILQYNKKILDENDKLKKLKWDNNKLCSTGCINFNEEELLLLYRSLKYVFGNKEVEII